MNYTAKFPVTHDMSPISYTVYDTSMETKEEMALWHYNRSREHDDLPPLDELPYDVEFVPHHE